MLFSLNLSGCEASWICDLMSFIGFFQCCSCPLSSSNPGPQMAECEAFLLQTFPRAFVFLCFVLHSPFCVFYCVTTLRLYIACC